MPFLQHKRLGFRAAISVALPMLVILSIASVISGVVTYRMANTQLENSVQNTVTDDLGLINEYLWQLDYKAIQSKLDAYVQHRRITGARITTPNGRVIQAGTLGQDPAAFVAVYHLEYPQKNSPVDLGVLTLEASHDESWAIARSRVISLVGIAAITVITSIFLILRLLDIVVLAPIKKIAYKLRQRPESWQDFRIDLDRVSHADELNELVGSIHEMRDHILTSQSETSYNQDRLAQAAQLAGLGYATSDQNLNRFLECDEYYAAMHGKTVEEMLALSVSTDLISVMGHPDDIEVGLENQQRLLHGESLTSMARVKMQDGTYRHIRKIFTPKEMPDGRTGVVDIVAQDLTELEDTKEQLLHSQKLEAVGKLSGGVAHDFNNILAIISGNLELLRDVVNKRPLTDFVETALIAVNRGATLTQRMLAFARKQTLTPEVIDVSKLVSGSTSLIRASVGATVNLTINTDEDHCTAKVDRIQLEAVLLNFVVNARDAMPGGGKLIVQVYNTELDETYTEGHEDLVAGDYICIAVTDSGEGMDEATVKKAFEPFFTTKEVGKGTGLGLSMAFGFAKQSGGHLRIYSEPGHGTTIKLYLPRVQADIVANASPVISTAPVALKDLQVFLVEDDDNLRKTMARQIRSFGCIVTAAADGVSAIEQAKEMPHIDILLSDMVLPGSMDGLKIAKEVAIIFPECAILFMSGFAETSILDNGSEDLGVSVLRKPFSVSSLQEALTNAIAA